MAGRTDFWKGPRPPQSRHLRAQLYASLSVPKCSSNAAEATKTMCEQWKDVLRRLAGVMVEVCSQVFFLHHLWHDFLLLLLLALVYALPSSEANCIHLNAGTRPKSSPNTSSVNTVYCGGQFESFRDLNYGRRGLELSAESAVISLGL